MADFDDDDWDDGDGEWHDDSWRAAYPDVPDDQFVWMLRQAWNAWHQVHRPGALLNQLEWVRFHTPEGRAGRPADAIGVTGATWNSWLLWARDVRDRDGRRLGAQPSRASREKIERVLARARIESATLPTRLRCHSVLVWARYQNRSGPVVDQPDWTETRSTTLDGLHLGASSAAWARGNDWAAAQACMVAVRNRYAVPVEMYRATELELKR